MASEPAGIGASRSELVELALDAAARLARVAESALGAATEGLAELGAGASVAPVGMRAERAEEIARSLERVVADFDALPWNALAGASDAERRVLRRLSVSVRQLAGSIRSLASEEDGLHARGSAEALARQRRTAVELRRFGEWLEAELDRAPAP